jgi:hypothetical protein
MAVNRKSGLDAVPPKLQTNYQHRKAIVLSEGGLRTP